MISDADALLVRAMREAAEVANQPASFGNPDRVALRLIEWYHRGARDTLESFKAGLGERP